MKISILATNSVVPAPDQEIVSALLVIFSAIPIISIVRNSVSLVLQINIKISITAMRLHAQSVTSNAKLVQVQATQIATPVKQATLKKMENALVDVIQITL